MTVPETSFAMAERITRLDLPERADLIGASLRQAERKLEENAARLTNLVDLTYADTTRFPAPDWAITAFTAAATHGGLSYTAYRGDGAVRKVVAANISDFIGIDVDPDPNLILTPGTPAALFAVLSAIVENGDKVAMMDPDYPTNDTIQRYLQPHEIGRAHV